MRTIRVMVDVPVADIATARDFSTDHLGLGTEDFDLGWVARVVPLRVEE